MTTKRILTKVVASGCLALMAAALTPEIALADHHEAVQPSYINFRIQTVKHDRVADWEQLRKEMRDAARAAGRDYYHVYERLRGPGWGFLIVSAEQGIGEPGGNFEAPAAVSVPESWFSAIFDTLDSQLVLSLEYLPGLRTLADGPAHPTAKFMHLRIRTAKPERGEDFEAWMRDDLVPALRNAEVGDVRNARVVLGASPYTFVTASFVDGWPYAPGGDPGIERALRKGRPLIANWIDYFYEFREDLSFTRE